MAKTITLSITQISRPADLQLRETQDQDHIAALVAVLESGGTLPPVKVVHEGNTYWLWDGHHTVTAHDTAGKLEVQAIVEDGDRKRARWLACSANSEHGLNRSNKTKRRQVEAALKINPKMSDRAIADHVKVSNHLVAEVRADASTGNSPSSTKRTGRDGKTRDTSKIAEANANRKQDSTPTPPAEVGESQSSPANEPDGAPAGSDEAAEGATGRDDPLVKINADIDQLISGLKAIGRDMRQAFGFQKEKETSEYKNNGLHRYSYSGTVGAVNQIASHLEDERPVEISKGKVTTKRGQHLRDAAEGKRR